MASQLQQVSTIDESLDRARLDFAQYCFTNAQELNRVMDQKAGFLLAAVALLTSAVVVLTTKVVSPQALGGYGWSLQVLAMAVLVIYAIMVFAVTYVVSDVYRAAPHARRNPQVPGLIFPLIIREQFGTDPKSSASEERYFAKLAHVDLAEILHDYANQIVEVSSIYARKHARINLGINLFGWMMVVWLVGMLLLLALLILG